MEEWLSSVCARIGWELILGLYWEVEDWVVNISIGILLNEWGEDSVWLYLELLGVRLLYPTANKRDSK